jgi:hypothetical protein
VLKARIRNNQIIRTMSGYQKDLPCARKQDGLWLTSLTSHGPFNIVGGVWQFLGQVDQPAFGLRKGCLRFSLPAFLGM